ncbi:hypothetical protein EGW08_020550 [Elysia chlorotica]|uniref:Uncharacterized protein n=1 Tax=Elysia chlorotica TaxID=188477 RepID=A0A433SR21_ELYCH|nr:hypothetical protein EGW08_020550 [Elysia chlorotica]
MPFTHNSAFDGIGFNRGVSHLVPVNQCQKRKSVFDMVDVDHDMIADSQHQWLGASSATKRQRLLEPEQSFFNVMSVGDGDAVVKEANNNNNTNNNNDTIKGPGCPPPAPSLDEEVMEEHTAMDSDFVPDMAQYEPTATTHSSSSSSSSLPSSSSTAQQISSPQTIYGNNERSGLKPSPVSGRLHCLCSASWRGMYGMEAAYMTDYY